MSFSRGLLKKQSRIAALLLAGLLAHASPVCADDVDSVCGGLANSPPPAAGSGTSATQQKQQYCQAAKGAQEGSNADTAGWKIWSAVGVVCAHACAASYAGGPASEYQCTGANISGGAADAVISKNFTSALTGLSSAGAGLAANNATQTPEATQQGAEPPKKKDTGACLSAVAAASQAYSKYHSAQNNSSAATSNLNSAQAVQAPTQAAAEAGAVQSQASTDSGAQGGGGSARSDNPCSSNMTPAATLQCAVANNSNLPAFVTKPGFAKEFQKDAGLPLGDFLSKNGPPGPLMATGMGNGRGSAQGPKIAAALDEIEQAAGQGGGFEMPGGIYSSNGGGGGEAGQGDEMSGAMTAAMQGLMDKLNPGKKGEDPNLGVKAVIFANQNRAPAQVAEDRKLSIFDRITYRYYFVGRRIVLGEGEK